VELVPARWCHGPVRAARSLIVRRNFPPIIAAPALVSGLFELLPAYAGRAPLPGKEMAMADATPGAIAQQFDRVTHGERE